MVAINRYDGPAFRLLRRFLKHSLAPSVDVKILSAEYGLISADYRLPYYDRQMTKEQSKILHHQVITGLEATLDSRAYTNLLIWLGQDYLEAIYGYEDIIPNGLAVQLATGGIGRKLSILHDWLYGGLSSLKSSKVPTLSEGKARIHGIEVNLTPEQIFDVARKAIAVGEERATCYQSWYVLVDDQRVAPKWLVSQLAGLPVSCFVTDEARRVLTQLGVEVSRV